MRPVPVLVTGASGFLGAHLVRALLAAGCSVHAVSRRPQTVAAPNLRWWQADLGAAGESERLLAGALPEIVFHLASLVTGKRDLDLVLPAFKANLEGTVRLLAAASAAPQGTCRRIVVAGTMEEPDRNSIEAPGSPYAVAKAAATLYARFFHSLYATPVVTARIFMVYGPGQVDHTKLVPYSILSALRGEAPRLTSGTRPVDWIYVDDVVSGLLAAAEVAGIEGETFDIGSGELVTVRQIVEKICHALAAPPPEIGALTDRPLEAVRRANIAKSSSRLGWRPTVGLEEGLHRTIVGLRGEIASGAYAPQGLMGIPRGTARLLLDEAHARPFSGSLLELGRMSVYATGEEMARWAREQDAPLAEVADLALSHQPELAAAGCLDDRSFFRLLGCETVESADVSDWEGADHLVDLNLPVPAELRGRFDTVFEAGTLQHIFDLPQVFANLHALLREGGRVIHGMAPSTNHVDHGFYMFSPTLFHDFYSANGWRIEASYFFEFFPFWFRGRFHSTKWRIRRYTPGCLDHLAYGGFGARQVALFVVATKVPGATADRIPQQSYFSRLPPKLAEAEKPLTVTGFPGSARALLKLKEWKQRLRRLAPRRLPPVEKRY